MKQALALAGVLVFGATAFAGGSNVRLQMDECALVPRDEVRRIVSIELRGALVDGAAAIDVVATCRQGATVELSARDVESGRTLERSVSLASAAASARPRLVALSIAELVITLDREREAAPTPKPAPPPPKPAPPPPKPAPPPPIVPPPAAAPAPPSSEPRRLQLSASAVGHGFFGGAGFVAGGGLRIAHDLRQHVVWTTDAFAEHGSASFGFGDVAIDVLSVDATLGYTRHWRRIGLRAAAGARGGAVRLGGAATMAGTHAATVWGPWGGPLARLSAVLTPWRRLVLELAVDGGYVIVPVAGLVDGQRKVAVDGGWIGFSVSVGAFL